MKFEIETEDRYTAIKLLDEKLGELLASEIKRWSDVITRAKIEKQ